MGNKVDYKAYTAAVKEAVEGQWLEVLSALAPFQEVQQAASRLGRHGPCPVHGGRDGFRFFRDAARTGGCICNTCGSFSDGWAALEWLNGWDFKTAVNEVGQYLGVPKPEWKPSRASKPHLAVAAVAAEEAAPAAAGLSEPPAWVTEDIPPPEDVAPAAPTQAKAAEAIPPAPTRSRQPSPKPPAPKKASMRQQQKESALAKALGSGGSGSAPVKGALKAANGGTMPKAAPAAEGPINDKAEALWQSAKPIGDEIAAYLKSRGIVMGGTRWRELEATDALRFHPQVPYFDEESGKTIGALPAVLAAIRDSEGRLLTVHRTYLNRSLQKATRIRFSGRYIKVTAKKMVSTQPVWQKLKRTISGAAIQLCTPKKGVLALAEGVETALAAYKATGIPVWATVSASMMEKVDIPPDVKLLIIWADRDRSGTGERAARALKERLARERKDVTVHIFLPPLAIPAREKGVDWNDVLVSQGLLGFPIRTLRGVIDGLRSR